MSNSIPGMALVTGASSGIGEAIARRMVKSGWRVVCAARRVERLKALSEELAPHVFPVALDVSDAVSVSSLMSRLLDDWRTIDVLVNNAGHDIDGRKRFDQGSIENWASTVQTNTIGTMRMTHAFVAGMIERGRGHIVNIGSIAGREAYAGGASYVASKFGIDGFTKAILADYRGQGVRVTQILPGLVRTEFAQARWGGDAGKAEKFYGDFLAALTPDDIARSVLFAIEQPTHVTISEIVVLPA